MKTPFPLTVATTATRPLVLAVFLLSSPAAGQPFAYVGMSGAPPRVIVIDTASNYIVDEIAVSVNIPLRPYFTPDGNKLYVTTGIGPLVRIDPVARQEIQPALDLVGSTFLDFLGETAYVTTGDTPTPGGVVLVDTLIDDEGDTIPLPNGTQAIRVRTDGLKAYVANAAANFLWILDLQQNEEVGTIPVGERPIGMDMTAAGDLLYVANQWGQARGTPGTVSIVDTTLGEERQIDLITVGGEPFDLTIRPDGQEIYVTNHGTDGVDIIDTTSGAVLPSIYLGGQPYHVAFTPDSRFAYVTNRNLNNVAVIDTVSHDVQLIEVGPPLPGEPHAGDPGIPIGIVIVSIDEDDDGFPRQDDCDDTDPAVNPRADELCDGIDNNCDGSIDEGFDQDDDGFTSCGGDCDDVDPFVNPSAAEVCDGIDNNCTGGTDEGFDEDEDGFTACAGDCDDLDSAVNPGAPEICDGIDNNCDSQIDEGLDQDGDGTADCFDECPTDPRKIFQGICGCFSPERAICEPISCVGFEPPMANGPVTVRGKGRALPLKAQLFLDGVEITDEDLLSPPVIQVFFDSGAGDPPTDVTDDSLPAGAGTEGNQFEYHGGKWQFNLKTKDFSATGTYTLFMDSGDALGYALAPLCVGTFMIE